MIISLKGWRIRDTPHLIISTESSVLLYARPRRQKDSLSSIEFDFLRVGSSVLATESHATLVFVTLTSALTGPFLWSHISELHHLIVTAVNLRLSD